MCELAKRKKNIFTKVIFKKTYLPQAIKKTYLPKLIAHFLFLNYVQGNR